MSTIPKLLILAALIQLVACNRRAKEPEENTLSPAQTIGSNHAERATSVVPRKPPISIFSTPADLSTATSYEPITIWVDNSGSPVPSDVLRALASAVRLRTYPELTLVDIDTSVQESIPPVPTPSGARHDKQAPRPMSALEDAPGRASISVVPRTALAQRWYVMSIDQLPAKVAPRSINHALVPQLGAFFSRFNPGTAPILKEVELCTDNAGRTLAMARFSESIATVQGYSKTDFGLFDATSSVNCTPTPVANPSIPRSVLQLECPQELQLHQRLGVQLGKGLRAASGAAVTTLNSSATAQSKLHNSLPQQLSVDLSVVREHRPHCKLWQAQ